jgi:hypothetical protein
MCGGTRRMLQMLPLVRFSFVVVHDARPALCGTSNLKRRCLGAQRRRLLNDVGERVLVRVVYWAAERYRRRLPANMNAPPATMAPAPIEVGTMTFAPVKARACACAVVGVLEVVDAAVDAGVVTAPDVPDEVGLPLGFFGTVV